MRQRRPERRVDSKNAVISALRSAESMLKVELDHP